MSKKTQSQFFDELLFWENADPAILQIMQHDEPEIARIKIAKLTEQAGNTMESLFSKIIYGGDENTSYSDRAKIDSISLLSIIKKAFDQKFGGFEKARELATSNMKDARLKLIAASEIILSRFPDGTVKSEILNEFQALSIFEGAYIAEALPEWHLKCSKALSQ